MNILPELIPALNDLQDSFSGRFTAVHAPRPNEVYFEAPMELVAGFCAHLYRKWNARLVSLFADDPRPAVDAFHLYYVFALDGEHGFFVLRVPVPADKPEFAALTDAVHAVNWQEREVQDMFGLKLLGHPNPRRCALHDDWPDVHPLRKDFDFHTVLPPFEGVRHKFREVEGEGVFQVPVGPVHAGIIEPGHFRASARGARRSVGREHFRRFELRARHGILPCGRAGRRGRGAAARTRIANRLSRVGADL
jgi:Ni,Fe-hydrogenase III component G